MSEEENWQAYRKDLEPKLMSNSSFIPFLGVYLSDVAMYQEARSMARRMEKGSERRRSSNALYDTYTLLEPITIRHRLQRLRSTSVKQSELWHLLSYGHARYGEYILLLSRVLDLY